MLNEPNKLDAEENNAVTLELIKSVKDETRAVARRLASLARSPTPPARAPSPTPRRRRNASDA